MSNPWCIPLEVSGGKSPRKEETMDGPLLPPHRWSVARGRWMFAACLLSDREEGPILEQEVRLIKSQSMNTYAISQNCIQALQVLLSFQRHSPLQLPSSARLPPRSHRILHSLLHRNIHLINNSHSMWHALTLACLQSRLIIILGGTQLNSLVSVLSAAQSFSAICLSFSTSCGFHVVLIKTNLSTEDHSPHVSSRAPCFSSGSLGFFRPNELLSRKSAMKMK